MDALKLDDPRDFVARQYASLVAHGLDESSALVRLREVLGAAAVESLGGPGTRADPRYPAGAGAAHVVVDAVTRLGGSAAMAQAELIQSFAEARLLAMDWWRPIRTFLLYILVLLALALVIAPVYLMFVLPAFNGLDQTMNVSGGAAQWITANGAIRLLSPPLVMAIMLAILATRWFRMRQRLAALEPLSGRSGAGGRNGGSVTAFQALRCLEFATAIRASGVADAAVLEAAFQIAGVPGGAARRAGGDSLAEKLEQAERLGTLGEELVWQRRVHWSTTQAQLELSRDRLILISRVLFYLLIGSMITVLYLPIFSIASMIGVH